MGAGASVAQDTVSAAGAACSEPSPTAAAEEELPPVPTIHLKKLPDAIEDSLYQEDKFPLLIDPSEQAARFLKYVYT